MVLFSWLLHLLPPFSAGVVRFLIVLLTFLRNGLDLPRVKGLMTLIYMLYELTFLYIELKEFGYKIVD